VDFEFTLIAVAKTGAEHRFDEANLMELARTNGATAIIKGGSGYDHIQDERLRTLLKDPNARVLVRRKN